MMGYLWQPDMRTCGSPYLQSLGCYPPKLIGLCILLFPEYQLLRLGAWLGRGHYVESTMAAQSKRWQKSGLA